MNQQMPNSGDGGKLGRPSSLDIDSLPGLVVRDPRFYSNIGDRFLFLSQDKLELELQRYRAAALARTIWSAPLSLVLALLLTLATADFRDALNVPASTWHAFFLILLVLSSGLFIGLGIWALSTKAFFGTVMDALRGARVSQEELREMLFLPICRNPLAGGPEIQARTLSPPVDKEAKDPQRWR